MAAVAIALPVRAALDDEGNGAGEEARQFRDYRVFWLGERFRSHELTHTSAPGNRFTFVYGDCDPGPDSGCSPPYQVQNYPACKRNPASYGPGVHPKRRKPIRGAAVYAFGDGSNFDMLEVYTGSTAVAIFAPGAAEAERVVHRLESINTELGRADPLGPPARGAVEGKLRCP